MKEQGGSLADMAAAARGLSSGVVEGVGERFDQRARFRVDLIEERPHDVGLLQRKCWRRRWLRIDEEEAVHRIVVNPTFV